MPIHSSESLMVADLQPVETPRKTRKIIKGLAATVAAGGLAATPLALLDDASPKAEPARISTPARTPKNSGKPMVADAVLAAQAEQQFQEAIEYVSAVDRQQKIDAIVGLINAKAAADWAAQHQTANKYASSSVEDFLACTRAHESDTAGGYSAVSPDGMYHGAYQFDQGTFNTAVADAGYPQYVGIPADQVPAGIQDAAATQLYSERGNQPWGGRC